MPSYKYSCLSGCRESFNKILKISERNEPTLQKCPSCGKENSIEKICEAPLTCNPFRISGTNSSALPGEMRELFKRISTNDKASNLGQLV